MNLEQAEPTGSVSSSAAMLAEESNCAPGVFQPSYRLLGLAPPDLVPENFPGNDASSSRE